MNPPAAGSKLRWYLSPDLLAPALLTLLGVLFFADPLFSSKNFYYRDILNFHYPLRRVLIDSYARGEFPLWNPFIHLGQPMLANPNYMAFYPTNLFHLFLPFNYAFKLHFIIHPILAGVGAYFLQRRLGILPLACFGGSLVYEFSGVVLSFLNLYNFVPSVALLPWIGWAFLAGLRRPGRRRILLFGLLLALQILSFDLFIALCDAMLLAGLSVIQLLAGDSRRDTLRAILRIGGIGALCALGLAAVQILPTAELIPLSVRGSGYSLEEVTGWSMHPMDFINVVVPNLFGNPYTLTQPGYWGEAFHSGREGYVISFFLGMGACLYVLLSFFSLLKPVRTVFALLALCSGLVALGRFGHFWDWLYRAVPIFSLGRYPAKFSLLLTLSVSVLVALGIEALLKADEERRRKVSRVAVTGLFAVALGAVVLGLAGWLGGSHRLEEFVLESLPPGLSRAKDLQSIAGQLSASLKWSGAFSLISGAIFLLSAYFKRPGLIGLLAVFALTGEVLPQNLRLVPLMSEADVDFVSDANRFLGNAGRAPMTRVLTPEIQPKQLRAPNDSAAWATLFARRAGLPIYGIMSGIQYSLYVSIDGLNTVESNTLFRTFVTASLDRKLEILRRTNSGLIATLDPIALPTSALLATFDTHSDLMLSVYRLDDVLERAYFVSGARPAGAAPDALRNFVDRSFPIRNTVILEPPGAAQTVGEDGAGKAKVIEYRNQYVSCRTESRVPGYVVLLDSFYPGWTASVDGRRVPVSRANYAFRAVEVPAGVHLVEFAYRPASFFAGLGITLLSLVTSVLALCLRSSSHAGRAGR